MNFAHLRIQSKNIKKLGVDRSGLQDMARSRDGWGRVIRPTCGQSLLNRQTAMMMMMNNSIYTNFAHSK